MPELPEVETVVRGLQSSITSQTITDIQVFRDNAIRPLAEETFVEQLIGHQIRQVHRRAKYLIFDLEPELYLMAHLRMTGKFIVTPLLNEPFKHHRVWFHLGDDLLLVFDDMRCFGTLEIMNAAQMESKLDQLGVEPLSNDLTVKHLQRCFLKSSNAVKNLLLDQSKIAGIGNIYASEILFDSKIDPTRSGKSIKASEWKRVIASTQKILKEAILKNGTSISDFRQVDEKTGEFQNFLKVYDKMEQPCSSCGTPIQRIVQQQRSSYYCPSCQH